ncbi:MAG: GAF domain-containing protein [Myxococcales bacterium]|nr:GAF domain-containing protein [Myxococcales bacterium]
MRTFAWAYNAATPREALHCVPFLCERYEELESLAPQWTQAAEVLDYLRTLPEQIERWLLSPSELTPARREFMEKVLLWLPPQVTAVIEDIRSHTGDVIRGYLISTWLLPEQHFTLPGKVVAQRIVQVGHVAERLGASVLGLGGYTSIFPPGIPMQLQEQLALTVTSGNCLTAAMALEGVQAGALKMGIDLGSCRIAVVGATGSIGGVCAEILARNVDCSLSLVARTKERLALKAEKIRRETGREVHVTTDLQEALSEANVVLLATSSPEALVAPHHLATGSVVCDVSRPTNVSRDVASARDDVLVIDGGLVEVPGGFTARTMHPYYGVPPGVVYACIGETMLLALENERERGLEIVNFSTERVQKLSAVAARHGFKLAHLRSFGEPIGDADIQLRLVRSGFRQRLAQLTMLDELAEAIDASADLVGFFRQLLRRMVRAFKAEAASLWLVDANGERIVCEASVGPAGEQLARFSVPIGTGIVGEVISGGIGQIVSNARAHAAFNSSADKQTGFQTRSMICSPLPGIGRAIGAIQVLNRLGEGEVFTGQDLALLSLLSRNAAIMVRSAQQGARISSGRNTRLVPLAEFIARMDAELNRARRHKLQCSILEICLEWQGDSPPSELALAEFTSALVSLTRSDDFGCRVSPAKFLVYLPHTGDAGAKALVQRARPSLEEKPLEGLKAISTVIHLLEPLAGQGAATLLEAIERSPGGERSRLVFSLPAGA